MSELSLEDLKSIMRAAVGDDEDVDLSRDILDVPFTDLGFDSLAMLEMATLVKRRTGIAISDDDLEHLHTPRGLLEVVAAGAVADAA
ncbi:acyl carrier protein [Actinomycetospora sp. NBRC 106378]|jgi:minimal PKS acyl carrier protein|uniref:acyl carrier protein n=1 Tax=Actinomycetospora sp. NBRC 106378 TaxID=3032208 RepID=UPI0024A60515|nr:acyl carrier protein [Actinomycetospora sp. NBRC 106378]GLZ55402.1 actinorhodin polyketide synthase [Actinomycetospora sp. NBRC 106378]